MDDIQTQAKKLKELCREKDAIFLAHNYQRDEIQEAADLTGDSLELSIKASQTDAKIILFCGVHFMAESAAILSPDKQVLLPRVDAGCPMADMITAEKLIEAKAERPDFTVVTYVNSPAAVKAESDYCCTSANAVAVVNAIDNDKIFFTPDQNLAKWTAKHTDKTVQWWDGYCHVHHHLELDEVQKAKSEHPNALFMAHPECQPEILDQAEAVRSTSGMLAFAAESDAEEYIVGTEMGLLYRLRKENPSKKFYPVSRFMVCPNMKKTTLASAIQALEDPDSCTVSVPEPIRLRAKLSLDRMLAIPRD
jgi:quinolinate synthase